MQCPYCLEERDLVRDQKGLEKFYTCDSPECKGRRIPVMYGDDEGIPKVPLCTVGFRGHGKTVYLAALFLSFEELSSAWQYFYTLPLNSESLNIVTNNLNDLKNHILPLPSQISVPTVAIIRFTHTPVGTRDFILYDTSGENFKRTENIQANTGYIRHARYALFFIDIEEQEDEKKEEENKGKGIDKDPAKRMLNLLQTYVIGMHNMDGKTKEQNLIVILTKGDQLERLSGSPKAWEYLMSADFQVFKETPFPEYTKRMEEQSRDIQIFLEKDLKAYQFLALCNDTFRTVRFCIVSALGSAPIGDRDSGDRIRVNVTPKRIFDPILWVLKEPQPDQWLLRQTRVWNLKIKQKIASIQAKY